MAEELLENVRKDALESILRAIARVADAGDAEAVLSLAKAYATIMSLGTDL